MIVKAKKKDMHFIVRLHRQSVWKLNKDHYSKTQLRGWTAKKTFMFKKFFLFGNLYVYKEDDKIIGFVNYKKNEVWGLYLSPEAKGKGIGKKLLLFAENNMKKSKAKEVVLESSLMAVNFYEHMGYVKIKENQRTFGGVKVTSVEMKKKL